MTHKRVAELIKNLLDANRTDNLNTWFPRDTVAALTIAMNDEKQIDSLEERTAPHKGQRGKRMKTERALEIANRMSRRTHKRRP
jgi:hypothetical protein